MRSGVGATVLAIFAVILLAVPSAAFAASDTTADSGTTSADMVTYTGELECLDTTSGTDPVRVLIIAARMDTSSGSSDSVWYYDTKPYEGTATYNQDKRCWTFTVEVPALGGARFQAVVKTKGVSASPLSHSYSCTLSPSGQVEGLLPGMVCKVYRDSEGAGGIIVPASVVRTDGNGRYVWTVADGKVVKKYIVTGKFAGKGVAVEDGLEAGDRVIVEGSQKVSSGMKVDARELEGRTSSGER